MGLDLNVGFAGVVQGIALAAVAWHCMYDKRGEKG